MTAFTTVKQRASSALSTVRSGAVGVRSRMSEARQDAVQPGSRAAFARWRRQRPWVGALLIMISGVEMFFSGQLDVGNIHVQVGIEGFQATIIPIGMVLLGVLILLMPTHRIFYGVIALALAVYSLIGVNLGGFILGMLLAAVGGVLAVSWMPKPARTVLDGPADEDALDAEAASDDTTPAEPLPFAQRRS